MASLSLCFSFSLFTLPISVSLIIYSNIANAIKSLVEFQVNMKVMHVCIVNDSTVRVVSKQKCFLLMSNSSAQF